MLSTLLFKGLIRKLHDFADSVWLKITNSENHSNESSRIAVALRRSLSLFDEQ